MIKTLKNLLKQDKERYTVPRKVQDVIPIRRIWKDGIFQVGSRFSKTYKFTDINYLVASREDKEAMFLAYSELLNSLDSGATTKITINNRRLNKANFEQSILMPMRGDSRDVYRREYNQMLLDKATGANGIVQEKYITISVEKKDIEEARTYFSRIGADLISHFAALGSKCTELDAGEKLRVLHDFYRQGEEAAFHFDPQDMMKKGHDFKDYICPDSMEKNSDYLKLGEKYCRVLFLKDYASYIKDSMVTELTDFNRNMMLSIDVVPVPTDEAVREVENRLLGVETNITNWQRRQNANNNFSAVVPYDMELQRKESKEFLDDLTTRDQRMMFAVITMVITADDKKQLDSDTETVLSVARKHMCQLAVLKFQQLDGLNTVLPIGTRKINAFRTLTTESLAVFMPFKVQEVQDKGGIYFGENAISHNLIMCNKANLLNQSAFLLGVPGSGKSFSAKELIAFLILNTTDDVLVCDPENEFGALAAALGEETATVIHMAAGGKDRLNAMYMVDGYTLYGTENTQPQIIRSRRRMGAVVESPAIYPDMTARENLRQQYRVLGLPSDDGIDELLRLVGLGDTGKKKAKNFSLGMRQRLGIAIALSGNPDFLVLDEPVNGLDPQGIIEMRELILKLNREHGITVLISSHILDELSRLATHYGFIDGGRMIKEMSAEELEMRCRKCMRIEVSDTKVLARVLDRLKVEYRITDDFHADIYAEIPVTTLVSALAKENCTVKNLTEKDESLESFYMNLVGGAHHA